MTLTPVTADSALDICSRALILIGSDPISSFDAGSTEALVCVNLYEDIVRTSLTNTRCRFSTNQKVLNRLTNEPTGRYDQAYQLPSDNIMVHALTVNDNNIDYQLYGDKAFANTSTADVVIADYTFRTTEINFPSYFTIAVEFSLAVILATSIARDANLAQLMTVRADGAMA